MRLYWSVIPRNLFLFFSWIRFCKKEFRFSYSYPEDVVHAQRQRKSIHLSGYDVPAISTSQRFIETS